MFELPSRKDVSKCVITKETISKGLKPTLVTSADGIDDVMAPALAEESAHFSSPAGASRRRRHRPGRRSLQLLAARLARPTAVSCATVSLLARISSPPARAPIRAAWTPLPRQLSPRLVASAVWTPIRISERQVAGRLALDRDRGWRRRAPRSGRRGRTRRPCGRRRGAALGGVDATDQLVVVAEELLPVGVAEMLEGASSRRRRGEDERHRHACPGSPEGVDARGVDAGTELVEDRACLPEFVPGAVGIAAGRIRAGGVTRVLPRSARSCPARAAAPGGSGRIAACGVVPRERDRNPRRRSRRRGTPASRRGAPSRPASPRPPPASSTAPAATAISTKADSRVRVRAGRSSASARRIEASAAAGLLAREEQQRTAGLGVVAQCVGLIERLLRFRKVAETQPHLTDLRVAGRRDPRRPGRSRVASDAVGSASSSLPRSASPRRG